MAYLAPACPELGTAQPQLVCFLIFLTCFLISPNLIIWPIAYNSESKIVFAVKTSVLATLLSVCVTDSDSGRGPTILLTNHKYLTVWGK
jgi:hypothetical protein